MAQRRRAEPITKLTLADGRTRYRAVCDFGTTGDGKRKQVRRTFDTQRAARDWLAESRTRRRDGTSVAPSKDTVDELLDRWLQGARHLKPSTRYGYEVHLRPVRAQIGQVRIQQLTKDHVERLVEHMVTTGGKLVDGKPRGRSSSTVRQALVILEQAVDDAERQGKVARNVVRLVKKPRVTRTEMSTWSAEQLATFLQAARADRYACLWRVAAFGLRRSEVMGLRWSDVDLEAGAVHVQSTRVSVDGKRVATGSPKTSSGRRTVPIDSTTVASLRTFKAKQAVERLAAGQLYDDTGLVAVDELGVPLRPEVFGDRFAKLSRTAGLPPIRLHDLRHTAATLMHASGEVPLRTLADLLGHADASFTLRTYAHSSEAGISAASRVLAGYFDGQTERAV